MIFSVLSRLALAAVLAASAVTWGAPPVAIASIVIGGSVIPLVLRRRWHDKLAMEELFERRLADAEDRYQQQMAEMEDEYGTQIAENTRQIADLEDRLDYTERLLERGRDRGMLPPRKHDPVMTPL